MQSESTQDAVLRTAMHNYEATAERLGLPDAIARRLAHPKEMITLQLHPAMPDGRLLDVQAHVVRHCDALGPAKGGIRMDAAVTRDMVTGLSMEMTWKTALIGVPFGGGKTGIVCNPGELPPDGKEILIRSFVRAARRHIGPEIYVPAPDMGTGQKEMGFIRDCISYSDGIAIPRGCFVTGKPVILGGIRGRREATGRGVVAALECACRHLGRDLSRLTVAVQGFGNVGAVAARELQQRGAKVVAVADLTGGTHKASGLDIAALERHVAQTGKLANFAGGDEIDPARLHETECDILLPAAAGSTIHAGNAAGIKARIIAEGANAPVTPEADKILSEAGVFFIPDILCNAGGVFVSYLEYTQETQREQMEKAEVEARLHERMETAFQEVLTYSLEKNMPMRAAAMDIAVRRVAEAITARGIHP
ncbi:MAG: Glu/Leu/Phe/Val dehydrogenase [Chthoniobacterales bacterium]|nr:Glu/Leu/Phe/Val dehydrogenase [Chthoniobacterales bacterium]